MRDERERTILHEGRLYYWYAGPYHDDIAAWDRVDSLFARGEISDSDQAIVIRGNVFLRVPEDQEASYTGRR